MYYICVCICKKILVTLNSYQLILHLYLFNTTKLLNLMQTHSTEANRNMITFPLYRTQTPNPDKMLQRSRFHMQGFTLLHHTWEHYTGDPQAPRIKDSIWKGALQGNVLKVLGKKKQWRPIYFWDSCVNPKTVL